jgi:hypothetical protein
MMNSQEVTAIARAIAREFDPHLHVQAVVAAEGGGERVEVLVTIAGCHAEPCVLMLNLTRSEKAMLERELVAKLQEALARHVTS